MRNFKETTLIILILFVVFATPINSVNAQKIGNGLEAEKPEIAVEIIIQSDKNINKDLIRSKVELKLRQNDIKVIDDLYNKQYFLSVFVHTLDQEYITSYTVEFSINRPIVYYLNGERYKRVAKTWEKRSLGYGKKENIIKTVEDYTDIFINEFYKANDF